MPLTQYYQNVIKGGVILTGNSLVINGTTSSPPQTTPFWVFAFMSTNLANQLPGFPPGTTQNYLQNSSSAQLNLPPGSTVEYAQLGWNITNATAGTENNAVRFTTPTTSTLVNPTIFDNSLGVTNLWRAADVTSIVNLGQSGTYTVGQVPSTVTPAPSICDCNWKLMVVYKNQNYPYRYININTGQNFLSAGSSVIFNFSNFGTPSSGPLKGYLLFGVSGADFTDVVQLRVGPNAGSTTLMGNTSNPWDGFSPYNRQNLFFASIICNADPNSPNMGLLDTTGSFGTYNGDPYTTFMPAFGRQLCDITGIDISNTLSYNQTSLYTQLTSGGGANTTNVEIAQLDVSSPDIPPVIKSVDKNYADVGDTLSYSIVFNNKGTAAANNLIFIDTIPNSLTFVPDSLSVNGTTQIGAIPPFNINIGTIPVNQTVTLTFEAIVNTIPTSTIVQNVANLVYDFIQYTGSSTIVDSVISNTTTTTILNATITSTKEVNNIYANIGDILTYTIPMVNSGNISANNIVFIDTIPNGTTIVSNSFTQDGVIVGGNPNPPGVTLPNPIGPGETSTVTFKVTVLTIPSPNPIPNSSTQTYDYIIDSTTTPNRLGNSSSHTNTVNTQVNNANLGNVVKSTDKLYARCGDIITYTVIIPNSGNITAQNIVLIDTIPNGTIIVPNSVNINGVTIPGEDPSAGITIPNIGPGGIATLTFGVQISC